MLSVIEKIPLPELCRADMDVVEQINVLFPTEQSLSQLDSVMKAIDNQILSLDQELTELVESHGNAGSEGEAALAQV